MIQNHFLGQSPLGFHKIAYTEWGTANDAPPVICVHGLTRNGRDFDWLAKTLQNTRHVFCPDIVGRGTSDWLTDPTLYNYPQYSADITTLIARATNGDNPQVDWVGTSMGGILGMLMAAQPNSPIRKLVVNDVGPFIPLAALKRIADYVSMVIEFANAAALERHIREIYKPFGITRDEDWQQITANSFRTLPNGKLALAHDPLIARNFAALDHDVDFWSLYDQIKCPVLLLRGANSDVLLRDTAVEMTQRGPRAQLIEFPNIGHAPALMDAGQIDIIRKFLDC